MKTPVKVAMIVVGLAVLVALPFVVVFRSRPPSPEQPSAPAEKPPPAITTTKQTSAGVQVIKIAGPLSEDPFASEWQQAPVKNVALMPQNIAMPVMDAGTVGAVNIQGLTDGSRIAWRLSWKDSSRDMNVDAGRFCDAVAVMFPLDTGAPFTMGSKGRKVQILHWKALWQKDVDEHFQDVQDLHPNFWSDLYWFAEGEFPYPVPDSFENPAALQWFVANQANNPVSKFYRKQPVEELVAEGFGSLTHQPESATAGRGVWKDGQWSVVFTRPLKTDDPLDYTFVLGKKGTISVAVWDGAVGNVGGRKHWALWIPFEVQP